MMVSSFHVHHLETPPTSVSSSGHSSPTPGGLSSTQYLLPPPSTVTGQDRSPAAVFHIIRRAGPPLLRRSVRLARCGTLLRALSGTSEASHAHLASSFAAFDSVPSCHHLLAPLRSSLCLGKDMPHGPHFCVMLVAARQRNLQPHAGVSRGDVPLA